jgi:hypothetical protein
MKKWMEIIPKLNINKEEKEMVNVTKSSFDSNNTNMKIGFTNCKSETVLSFSGFFEDLEILLKKYGINEVSKYLNIEDNNLIKIENDVMFVKNIEIK